jgi:hypothetical protein
MEMEGCDMTLGKIATIISVILGALALVGAFVAVASAYYDYSKIHLPEYTTFRNETQLMLCLDRCEKRCLATCALNRVVGPCQCDCSDCERRHGGGS